MGGAVGGFWKVRGVQIQKIPKRAAKAVIRVRAALFLYLIDAQGEISRYPEQEETSYVRTGILGQGWTSRNPRFDGPDLVAHVGTRVAYAGRVQGRFQEDEFKKRGWPNIVDVNTEVWKRHRALLVAAIKG